MRQILPCLLAFLGTAITAPAAEPPRDILRKSIQAMGGEALLRQARAEQVKVKGVLRDQMKIKGAVQDIDDVAFSGEIISQPPNQSKAVLHLEVAGVALTVTQVHNGNRGWVREMDDAPQVADQATLTEMKQSGYVDSISTLVPLLDDKTYALSVVPDAKVRGQAANGILVKSKGQPDVRLYFDRDSGLLLKSEYRCPDIRKQEILREEYLSDYREVNPAAADEQTLQAAKVPADGPALLEFLRKRTLDEARRDKIETLIRKLGDNSFESRQRAKEAIVGEGAVTLPLLTKYLKDPDPEIAGRAKECLQRIAKPSPDIALASAVVRLVAQRHPAGASRALLAYLPSAPDDVVAAEVRTALAAIAYQDGKPDPALTQALEDKETERRAAAAVALGRDESDREARTERVFLRGLKHAMKGVEYRDGKKSMEWELTDVQYFKSLGAAVFAKP